jgi:hypothetical protein
MANTKISNLTSAGTLTGSEVAPIVQSGSTVKATAQNIANLAIPSQTGQSGKYLTTNGTTASWGTVSGGGKVFVGSILPLGGSTIFLTTNYSTFTSPFAVVKTSTEFRISCAAFNGTEIILLGNFFGALAAVPSARVTYFSNYISYNAGSKYHSFELRDDAGLQVTPLSDYAANVSMQLNVYQP